MNGRPRFEWSWGGASPDDWTLLGEAALEQISATDQFPGWFLPSFELWDECSAVTLKCRFLKWASDEPDVAEYVAAGCYGALPFGTVLARQVPACLVVRCALAVQPDNQTFEATFATLAGNEIHRAQNALPEFLTVGHLLDDLVDTLEAKNMLQSCNQCIRLVLNNEPVELPAEAVLWCEAAAYARPRTRTRKN